LRFVFPPPPNVVAPLAVMPSTPDTLGPPAPSLAPFSQLGPAIPVHGSELSANLGKYHVAAIVASLPSLPGTAARVRTISALRDDGDGNQLGAQIAHFTEAGDPQSLGVLFGSIPSLDPGPQGPLPTSTLSGQRNTLAGIHYANHRQNAYALADVGVSWYDATYAAASHAAKPGAFYHVGYAYGARGRFAQLDAYRFEPRYAQIVLPYGTPENIWAVAWSWPGVWLKSTYQVIDNSQVGINRQGFRLKYSNDASPVMNYHVSYARFWQIEPASLSNAREPGFVEGFFLPQSGSGTIGAQEQLAGYLVWHTPYADLAVDAVEDRFYRATPGDPREYVSYHVPQYIISASRTFGTRAVTAVGLGRYGLSGSWASFATNVQVAQRQVFAGLQYQLSPAHLIHVQARRFLTDGTSATPGIPANANASVIVIEDRISF